MDNEEILEAASKLGLISDAKRAECRDLAARESVGAAETLVRCAGMTRDQIRGVKVLARYDHSRREDENLGTFVVQNGFLPAETVRTLLAEQESAWNDGEAYPRLQETLQQRGHLNAGQIQTIVRTYLQVQAARMQLQAPGQAPPPMRAAEFSAPSPPAAPPRRPEPVRPAPSGPITDEAYKRHSKAAGEIAEKFVIGLRRTRLKDATKGDMTIIMLDLEGNLHPQASTSLDDFVHGLITDGATRLAINAEKLEAISEEGIETLAGAAKRCREAKGDLRLCNAIEKVRKALEGNPLSKSLRIYEGERGVIMSFKYM